MRLESYLVAEMLKGLDSQAAKLRSHTATIAKALSAQDHPMALEAARALETALGKFVATTGLLEQHIVAQDGLGALGEALDELILRARARVVQEAIGQLRAALVPVDGQGRSGDWYIGRFRCFADVATFVEERIAQVHGYWRPYRHDQPRLAGMTEADRELVYNAMLRTGQSALRLLDQEADLVCFLEAGARATDLPAIQQACRAIASMLGFRIEVEPGCSLRRPRAAPLSGAAEGQ
jgi:hypothetical protein